MCGRLDCCSHSADAACPACCVHDPEAAAATEPCPRCGGPSRLLKIDAGYEIATWTCASCPRKWTTLWPALRHLRRR